MNEAERNRRRKAASLGRFAWALGWSPDDFVRVVGALPYAERGNQRTMTRFAADAYAYAGVEDVPPGTSRSKSWARTRELLTGWEANPASAPVEQGSAWHEVWRPAPASAPAVARPSETPCAPTIRTGTNLVDNDRQPAPTPPAARDRTPCSWCGQIVWWVGDPNPENPPLPLDPDPVPGGAWLVTDGVAVPRREADGDGYAGHLLTCPNRPRTRGIAKAGDPRPRCTVCEDPLDPALAAMQPPGWWSQQHPACHPDAPRRRIPGVHYHLKKGIKTVIPRAGSARREIA